MCDLNTTLLLLTQYGRPRLSQMSDARWYCAVDMHVAAAGAEFKVASDFDCPGPLAATEQCLERVHDMLQRFGANKPKALPHG